MSRIQGPRPTNNTDAQRRDVQEFDEVMTRAFHQLDVLNASKDYLLTIDGMTVAKWNQEEGPPLALGPGVANALHTLQQNEAPPTADLRAPKVLQLRVSSSQPGKRADLDLTAQFNGGERRLHLELFTDANDYFGFSLRPGAARGEPTWVNWDGLPLPKGSEAAKKMVEENGPFAVPPAYKKLLDEALQGSGLSELKNFFVSDASQWRTAKRSDNFDET